MEPISDVNVAFNGLSWDQIVQQRAEITPEERAAQQEARARDLHRETVELGRRARPAYFARLREQFGERFESRRFENWNRSSKTEPARMAALTIAEDPRKRGGWFFGPVDTGKTHLAAAIGHRAIDAQIPTVFTTGIRLLERIRDTYDRDGSLVAGKHDIIGSYASVDVLILDDLGKERWTPWVAERMYDLANRRYEANLAMVATSNLDPSRLASLWTQSGMDEYYGRSIVRRIAEMCSGNLIPIVMERA